LGFSSKNLMQLQASLAHEISTRFSQVETIHKTDELTIKRTMQLPAEPDDPDKLHILLRRIECTQVYRRIRIDLLVDCNCCGLKNTVGLEVLLSTGRVALRQTDHLSDGNVRMHFLGF
jgi:hypothetical protein